MPASVVNTVSKKCDLSLEEAEAKGDKAKKTAEKEGHKEDGPYVMEIFKHMVGKECMKKMNWANEEIKMRYYDYLSEEEKIDEAHGDIDFKRLKAGLKDFDSKYKEFRADVRSKDVTGTITSFVALRMKMDRLDQTLQSVIKQLG